MHKIRMINYRHVILRVSFVYRRPADVWDHSSRHALWQLLDRKSIYQWPHVNVKAKVALTIWAWWIAFEQDDHSTSDGNGDRVNIKVAHALLITNFHWSISEDQIEVKISLCCTDYSNCRYSYLLQVSLVKPLWVYRVISALFSSYDASMSSRATLNLDSFSMVLQMKNCVSLNLQLRERSMKTLLICLYCTYFVKLPF